MGFVVVVVVVAVVFLRRTVLFFFPCVAADAVGVFFFFLEASVDFFFVVAVVDCRFFGTSVVAAEAFFLVVAAATVVRFFGDTTCRSDTSMCSVNDSAARFCVLPSGCPGFGPSRAKFLTLNDNDGDVAMFATRCVRDSDGRGVAVVFLSYQPM